MIANPITQNIAILIGLLSLSYALTSCQALATPKDKQQHSNDTACRERAGDLDKCLPKLVVYGDREFEPPRNDKQLDEHCNLLDVNLKCVSSYSRECLPSFARSLYSVLLRRLKSQFTKRCKSKEGREDFMNLMACADSKHMEPAHKCMDSFVAHLEHIGSGQESRQIELICCTFQLFQECIFSASRKMHCNQRKVTAEKSIEYVGSLINAMGGDIMEFTCGKYNKVSACDAGHPKIMGEFRDATKQVEAGNLKPKSSSPVGPMLQLFIEVQSSE